MNEDFREEVKFAQWWGRALIKSTYFIKQKIMEVMKVSFRLCHMTDLVTLCKTGLVPNRKNYGKTEGKSESLNLFQLCKLPREITRYYKD